MRLLLLLLFVSCVSLSKAYDEDYVDVEYGQTHRFYITRKADVVEFNSDGNWETSVLWKRDDPRTMEGKKWRVIANYFSIIDVTHGDSGEYVVRDDRRRKQLAHNVNVFPKSVEFSLDAEEYLHFSAPVEQTSCNIFFIPKDEEIHLVRRGKVLSRFNANVCGGIYFTAPCQMSNDKTESSCSGRFEVRDENDQMAMVVNVYIKSFPSMYFIIGGVILAVILIGCCATRCCRGRSSSQKKASQPVLIRHDEYASEPVGGRRNQLSEPSRPWNPAQSSSAATGPLIHDPPTVNVPPACSSMFLRVQQPDAAADPLCSDPEPRFELKGLNFNFESPLGSDSTRSNVYTSDKLNFL